MATARSSQLQEGVVECTTQAEARVHTARRERSYARIGQRLVESTSSSTWAASAFWLSAPHLASSRPAAVDSMASFPTNVYPSLSQQHHCQQYYPRDTLIHCGVEG